MRRFTSALIPLVAAAAVVLSACASPTSPSQSDGPTGDLVVDRTADVLICQGSEVSRAAIEDAQPATELSDEAQIALESPEFSPIRLDEWIIERESEGKFVLLRPRSAPAEPVPGDTDEWDILAYSKEFRTADASERTWMLMKASSCSLAYPLDGMNFATVTLDPARLPEPGHTTLALLVTETACSSGEDAEGRVELVELSETETMVELVIAVQPSGAGAHTCPGNPATPFTVDLEHPIGERQILNAGVVPSRDITADVDGSFSADSP